MSDWTGITDDTICDGCHLPLKDHETEIVDEVLFFSCPMTPEPSSTIPRISKTMSEEKTDVPPILQVLNDKAALGQSLYLNSEQVRQLVSYILKLQRLKP